MHIQRSISRALAAAVASSGFFVVPMHAHAATLTCTGSSFSASPDGQGNITINCTSPSSSGGGGSACTISVIPTSLPASGGNVSISASGCTTPSVSGGKSVTTTSTGWTDTIGPNASSTSLTYTYTVNGGTSGSDSKSVVQSGASTGGGGSPPPGGGSVTCPGYSNTINVPLTWGTATTGNPRGQSSGFGNSSIVVAQFTTPANLPTGVGGAIKIGEWTSATTMRSVAISTTPCDFPKPNPLGKSGTQTNPNNTSPTINYLVGTATTSYVGLQPGTTYYVSIVNAYTSSGGSVVPTCGGSSCNVFVELDKPAGF